MAKRKQDFFFGMLAGFVLGIITTVMTIFAVSHKVEQDIDNQFDAVARALENAE